eukprot:4804430-Alexandrium_andersonii.AAC.1
MGRQGGQSGQSGLVRLDSRIAAARISWVGVRRRSPDPVVKGGQLAPSPARGGRSPSPPNVDRG